MKAIIIVAFALFSLHAISSDSIPHQPLTYKSKLVTLYDRTCMGYLSNLTDSKIYISNNQISYGEHPNLNAQKKFSYTEMSQVSLRQKGSIGRGILIGTISGSLFGAFVGLIAYQKPNCGTGAWVCIDLGPSYSALGGGIVGALTGALIGGIIGATNKKVSALHEKKEKHDAMKISVLASRQIHY
ncbi:hypothetical protein OCK74_17045 [Chitinophagaceae bacterium LB-8]|uniref:Glycine zipper family protein n=1 Tax=Paraflavisolibacter caeni TaxID=2982496 RepID=A0A9X2XPG5_9BACT|nr:hypothetical protein [Paraflavisolibacter caeni]MCU7550829.1 hypothetical protein [Paraflavisolibacter caeni]